MAVEVLWHSGLKRLAHMSGAVGTLVVWEEPDWWGDVHVRVAVPIGTVGQLVLDEAEVEDMELHAGEIGIDMEAVDVLISNVSLGPEPISADASTD